MSGPARPTGTGGSGGNGAIRVLVCDDSAVSRQLLVHILNAHPRLHVVAEAADGAQTIRLAERIRPEVIVMDVMMPLLDGLQATREIMQTQPTPIVLVSAGYNGTDLTRSFQALQAGALTILSKPRGPQDPCHAAHAAALTTTVTRMAGVKLVRRRPPGPAAIRLIHPVRTAARQRIAIAAIAASTGGPQALAAILGALPGDAPVPILIVQHIAAGFDAGLAEWLNGITPLSVRLARHGEPLLAGRVLLAPSDSHLGVSGRGTVQLSSDPPIGAHRPSATYLFRSVAKAYPGRAVGVILTGMGDDGAQGLRAVKDTGGLVLAQDEATSVVYGMPRQAAALGAVDQILPLDQIASTLTSAWEATDP